MISLATVRSKGKQLAQDAGPGDTATGVQLLLTDPGDYNAGILQALRIFAQDRPNQRVVDQVLAAAGFRIILAGSGAISSLVGPDTFQDGTSHLDDVFYPWNPALRGLEPLDQNSWRVVRDPGGVVVLELFTVTPGAGDTIRLVFTTGHQLTEAPNSVAAPAAPSVALVAATPGQITNGGHSWKVAYLTAHGGTTPGPASATVTIADQSVAGQVDVTAAASDDTGVTGVAFYRTEAGLEATGPWKLVGTIGTNGGTLRDNVADGDLGAVAPTANTAGGQNTVLEGDEDTLAVLVGSMILQLAATKAAQNTGNTGLPNDVVDRRSQSDIFRSRAKELRDWYNNLVGRGSMIGPASGIRDLNVSTRGGFLWRRPGV
jgi:hypothetical protein